MSKPNALIVDDEHDIRELLALTLERMGLQVESAYDLTQAREKLQARKFDLCLTDMRLPDGDGLDLIKLVSSQYPNMPIAMITAYGDVQSAVRALKAGAFDFVNKPVDLQVLRQIISQALALRFQHATSTQDLIGDSEVMQLLRRKIDRLARSQAPVLVCGESGVGKELVAKQIHRQSVRNKGPFIAVNCGAIPYELMESEFFGHKKGSFTGAHADKEGLFQAAQGGTLFLDEVAELPLHMQVKLLRVIQEKSVRAIGEVLEKPIDVRILSATHKNLSAEVAANRFRHDLFYRINVIELPVPALRERGADVLLLAHAILQRIANTQQHGAHTLSLAAAQTLSNYPFPGNVRELENILERAVALCQDATIHETDLQLFSPTPANHETANDGTAPDSNSGGLPKALEHLERAQIQAALEACRFNKTRAAAQLGITFRALRYKMEKLGMD